MNIIKWVISATLLTSMIISVVGMFSPTIVHIVPNLTDLVSTLLAVVGGALYDARGFINYFFLPWAMPLVSFAITWSITKPFQMGALAFIRSIVKGIFS